ncbi:serine hydrolase [Mitsuaria sp. GD03876]|uniref:serine hydrolase n=1 Tax=Mitsuaria sp. GD03876 TaxID=2975399 RepID=UPI0024474C17|nr:serine hydrolase [Mitsuaria sp. GD03876]MDH0865230.1 beta-lactamase family protein [Mitsuaria sp. GD03876]
MRSTRSSLLAGLAGLLTVTAAAGTALALMASPSSAQTAGQATAEPAAVPPAKPLAPKTPEPPPASAVPLTAQDLAAWLDGRVPYSLEAGDIAGAVVSVVKDGKVLVQKGYGYADVKAKVPMDPEKSMIRPGSTSKLFTWTAVMQLVQQGKLNLDRDVNDYLDFKIPQTFGQPVTLRHLMNHTAGFEEGLKDLLAYDPKLAPSNEDYLKQHPRPMLFAPGTVPGYSNYGVALAGYIVQRVSGEPFETYVDRHVFQPLGMRHSTMAQPLPKPFEPFIAKGYRQASDAEPSPFELVVTAPAGSGSATAADMARFMLAHLQQGKLDGVEILNPATAALMATPSAKAPPGFAVMAHGFFREFRNGRVLLGHGGDTIVFHSDLALLPAEGVGIFVSFNSRGKDSAVYLARKALIDGFFDRYFPAPPVVDAPALATAAQDAARIAGRYQSSRRVEHGFLSALYLMSQTVITAQPDGTILAPSGALGEMATFREVAPQRWRKLNGTAELAFAEVGGVRTVVDSENPVSVLQEAPVLRSAPVTLTVLGLSVLVLLGTLVAWPFGALLRKADRATSGTTPEVRRLRRWQRIAVVVDVVYLGAWFVLIQPVLSTEIALYNGGNDALFGAMQLSGVLAVAAAIVGLWAAWRMFRVDASRLSRAWSVAVALALAGVVWIGVFGQLMALNLNY